MTFDVPVVLQVFSYEPPATLTAKASSLQRTLVSLDIPNMTSPNTSGADLSDLPPGMTRLFAPKLHCGPIVHTPKTPVESYRRTRSPITERQEEGGCSKSTQEVFALQLSGYRLRRFKWAPHTAHVTLTQFSRETIPNVMKRWKKMGMGSKCIES